MSDKGQIKYLTSRIPIVANENMGVQQTTVLITSAMTSVVAKDDFTGKICKKLKESGTTKILRMITIWRDGGVDISSYAFRKALVEMDEANYETEIVFSNGIKKLRDTIITKKVLSIIVFKDEDDFIRNSGSISAQSTADQEFCGLWGEIKFNDEQVLRSISDTVNYFLASGKRKVIFGCCKKDLDTIKKRLNVQGWEVNEIWR